MTNTQYYCAEVHVRTTAGDLVTYYHDGPGPAGMSASEVRAAAEKAALAWEPGGKVEGSRVSCN
ncbi:hypothetical protein [Kitasatospora sp. NPDC001175]|uniref:hypothetical protein n=1 Tax=Kitasatospora sp. NPDC001175 TaxID=3157103 RepID=UPI003D02A120